MGIKSMCDIKEFNVREYEDGDILILTKILTHNESDDEDDESPNFRDPVFSDPILQLENKTFQHLEYFPAIEIDTFPTDLRYYPDEKAISIEVEERKVPQIIEDEPFIPILTKDTRVFLGSLNNFYPILRFMYTIYE